MPSESGESIPPPSQLPTNVAPPKTKTCPDGSVVDAKNGKCPPITKGSDQGGGQGLAVNDEGASGSKVPDEKHNK